MQRYLMLLLMMASVIFSSCEEDDPETTILVTEEVLITSGEQARLLGRLITNQAINPKDHGFQLSEDQDFSSPIIIALGPKEGPGRFIGEVTGLKVGQTYFARAYMDLGAGLEFGNTIELNTLEPGVESFEPSFGKEGSEIFIFGRNFTEDTRVFFGDQEAAVTEILFETRLRVIAPSATTSATVPLRVVVQDRELVFDLPFEYQIGTYETVSEFPQNVRLIDNLFFQKGDEFFVGLGSVKGTSFYSNIFKYNPGADSWVQVPFEGTNRSFGWATENYLGGGIRELGRDPFLINRNFYRFNGSSFVQLADLPFDSRESIAFEVGGFLFVIGGKEGNPLAGWRYEMNTGLWTQIAEAPFPIDQSLGSFTYQNERYFINSNGNIVKYIPFSDTWEEAGFFPGSTGQGYPIAQVTGNRVYLGAYRRSTEMWEWNMDSRIWTAKNDVPGISQNLNGGYWVRDGFLYFLRVPELSVVGDQPLPLIKFDPSGI